MKQPTEVHRLVMPHTLDHRLHIELKDHKCTLFSREDVPNAHIREIKDGPHIFYICCTLHRDMMTLMHHVVDALMLIRSL